MTKKVKKAVERKEERKKNMPRRRGEMTDLLRHPIRAKDSKYALSLLALCLANEDSAITWLLLL